MAKDKYEVHVGTTRFSTTRADGTELVIEAGESYEPKNEEEAQILRLAVEADTVPVKKAEKGSK